MVRSLRARLVRRLHSLVLSRTKGRREPDLVIRENYMRRWYVIPRNRFLNIYYNEFSGPDETVLHDHPWVNLSLVLRGIYAEFLPDQRASDGIGARLRLPGDLVARRATAMHYIEPRSPKVCTLFITGPRVRDWGFLCPNRGWVSHKDYVDPNNRGQNGAGCGEPA